MIKASTPIEFIEGLSNHTIQSLNRNNIFFIKDLFPYKDDTSKILELPGIGKNVIEELKTVFKNIELYNRESLNDSFQNTNLEEDDKLELSPFFIYKNGTYYLNSLCYIVFSSKNYATKRLRNNFRENLTTFFDLICKEDFGSIKSLGKGCLREITEIKYKIFEYYGIDNSKKILKLHELYSHKETLFEEVNSLNLKDCVLNFYNNLSELEKDIILYRENWFRNDLSSSLRKLGENNNVHGERIRQYGVLINSDFDFYLQYYSQYFENYIEDLLKLDSDFEIRKLSDIEEFSQFTYEFIDSIFSKIITTNYLYKGNDLGTTFFFLKKSKIGEVEKFKLFDVIDYLFNKERKIDKTMTLSSLIKLGLGENINKKVIKDFIPVVKGYLECGYNIKTEGSKIIFPINKRDYPILVINELKIHNKRIHFSKLYKKLEKKYPQYSRNESTIHSILQASPDTVNVGPGLYIHKSKRPDSTKGFETIVEVIEKYLEGIKVKCATIDDIIKHVKKQKKVSDGSIKYYLMSDDKFINIGGGIFGLLKYWEGKRMIKGIGAKVKSQDKTKSISIVDIVEKYLEGKENKCADIDAIVKYAKTQKIASEKYIIHIVRDKTKNKNKFMRIGTGIFGLTNYWEGKSVLQESEISKIKTESKKEIKSPSIANLVEQYLEGLKDHYATTDAIVKYVKNQKLISDKSIKEYIRSKDKNRNKLMRLGRSVYGLTKYWEGKPIPQVSKTSRITSGNIVDIIERFMENTKNKCATTKDIIKYVQKQRTASEESIRFCLYSKKKNDNKFVYIGELTYGLTKYWEGKPKLAGFETITNIIEKCLKEKEDKSATKKDIIKYVQKQKKLSEKTVSIYLTEKKRNKNKFIYIGDGKYGLTKYWEGKSKLVGSETIVDIIEKCLEGKENKCATFDEIVRYVKKQKNASEHTIKRYLKTGKRNKNKFMRVGTLTYGLTDYREGRI